MLHHLQTELGDLAIHELRQLMEDLTQEIAQCKVNVPPSSPLQIHGYAHRGEGTQKRMTGRPSFQEGEGGVHWGNPLHLQSPSNQLEEGFPLDHHCKCHVLPHPGEIWGNWLPPWHWVCAWAPQKLILSVVTLPLAKQRYCSNNGTMRFTA